MPRQYQLTQDDVAFMRSLALNTNSPNTVALPHRIFEKSFSGAVPDSFSNHPKMQSFEDIAEVKS